MRLRIGSAGGCGREGLVWPGGRGVAGGFEPERPNVAFGALNAPNVAFGALDAPNVAFGALDAPNVAFGALDGL